MKKYFLILSALGLAAGLTVNAQHLGTRQLTSSVTVSNAEIVVASATDRVGGLIINSVGTSNVVCYVKSGLALAEGVTIAPGGSITFGLTPPAATPSGIFQGNVFCINPVNNTNTVTSIQILK